LELSDHVKEDLLEQLVTGLLGYHLQGFHDRDAGFDENAQLAGEVHDLFTRDHLLGDLELEDALMFLYVDRLQPALNEHEVRCTRRNGLLGPAYFLAAIVERAVAVAL
jgi:hypothetical protein